MQKKSNERHETSEGTMASTNNYPKLHNAMWPGVVGKGSGDGEPFIPLDTLLTLTRDAEYEGQKFDGVDLWLADPHISIDSTPDDVKRVSDHISSFGLKIGSMVAPIWGGPAAARRWARPTIASASSTRSGRLA
jgi:hypothetical protein